MKSLKAGSVIEGYSSESAISAMNISLIGRKYFLTKFFSCTTSAGSFTNLSTFQ
jgi:hypothetical protein